MPRRPTKAPPGNREQWLTELGEAVRHLYSNFNLKPFRLTCGWPCINPLGRKVRRIGECHPIESSPGGFHEIFISPLVGESIEVAGVACHELGHVAAGTDQGHKGLFLKVCREVGLTKNKPTQAMPGERLTRLLEKVIGQLGPYPHKPMQPFTKRKERSNTDLTLTCVECGCKVRISIKWAAKSGLPVCGCGGLLYSPGENTDE
jgi:hypothetical protein